MEQPENNNPINQLNREPQTQQLNTIVYISEDDLPIESRSKSLFIPTASGLLIVSLLQIIHLFYSASIETNMTNRAANYLMSGGMVAIQTILALGLLSSSRVVLKLYIVIAWLFIAISAVYVALLILWFPIVLISIAFSSSTANLLALISLALHTATIIFWSMGLAALHKAKLTAITSSSPQQNPNQPLAEEPKKSD